MKRHLNTLFVTTDGSYVSKEGQSVVVKRNGEQVLRVPALNLDGVVFVGRSSFSTGLLRLCSEAKLTLSVLSPTGRFVGRFEGPTSGNVLLRRDQYRCAHDPQARLDIARRFVLGKLANTRSVLLRAVRDHGDSEGRMKTAAATLNRGLQRLEHCGSLDELRGFEGEGGRAYFEVFQELITQDYVDIRFNGRSRRPPMDPVNAMLSFAYGMLRHDVSSACEAVGLDPQVGFLHQDRPGRAGLALDLMEELRPLMADRVVLTLINRSQISAEDFEVEPGGAIRMKESARKTLIVTYQKRKQDEISHPFLGEQTTLGLIPHIQARLLARVLRGDLDGYPPFVPK